MYKMLFRKGPISKEAHRAVVSVDLSAKVNLLSTHPSSFPSISEPPFFIVIDLFAHTSVGGHHRQLFSKALLSCHREAVISLYLFCGCDFQENYR